MSGESAVGAELETAVTSIRAGGSFSPNALLQRLQAKRPQFRGGRQQDSHELLRNLLDVAQAEDSFRGWLCGMTQCGKSRPPGKRERPGSTLQSLKFFARCTVPP